jgi:rRNA-processing protein FCF1
MIDLSRIKKESKKYITIAINESVYKELEKISKENEVAISNLTKFLVEESVKQLKEK